MVKNHENFSETFLEPFSGFMSFFLESYNEESFASWKNLLQFLSYKTMNHLLLVFTSSDVLAKKTNGPENKQNEASQLIMGLIVISIGKIRENFLFKHLAFELNKICDSSNLLGSKNSYLICFRSYFFNLKKIIHSAHTFFAFRGQLIVSDRNVRFRIFL